LLLKNRSEASRVVESVKWHSDLGSRRRRAAGRAHGIRAFTLLESMVTVAVLGIVAALALPNLTPMIHRLQLSRAGSAVAAFVSQAQTRAMADRRCTRVRVVAGELVSEVANVFDCGDSLNAAETIATATRITGVALDPPWLPIRTLAFEHNLAVSFAGGTPVELPGELRFRQSGRVWSSDQTVMHYGRICSHPAGNTAPIAAGTSSCP
jgi:prepilin-type N-terminal cleavage/methylation domain-containing protein